MTPVWLAEAQRHIGLREVKGAKTEPRIAAMLKRLKAWWSDDETPWCGTFAAHCMTACGIPAPAAWYRAKAWADWGQALSRPAVGCIVVFDRTGGGHVAFVTGRDQNGRLLCLGGNQGDAVNVRPFPRERAIAFRWPPGEPLPVIAGLPVINSTAASSENEA